MEKSKAKRLCVLMIAAILLFLGVWLEVESRSLEQDILRLHVLANSDEEADQQLKLIVRDRILEASESILAGVGSREEAMKLLNNNIAELVVVGEKTVAEAGYCYPVAVSVEKSWFPTKQYQDFSLPAGYYTALRVEIGAGMGQNWWCVLFPPLCLGGASEKVEVTAAMAGLDGDDISLITGEDGGYIVKFKLLEIWGQLKQRTERRKTG